MESFIQSLRVTHHQPPRFDTPVSDSTLGPTDLHDPSVLRVRTNDGCEGIALTTFIESRIIRTVLTAIVLGERVRDWPRVRQRAFWALRDLGHAGVAMNALSSLDIAVHDALGQLDDTPLWQRFTPSRPRVTAYGSGGWTSLSVDALVSEMARLVQRGFTTVKMRVGLDHGCRPKEDVERVRTVRDAIGPDIALAVDANQCWDTNTALRVAREIAEYNIAWIEEPVFAHDRQAAAVFRRESPIPLACGESERLAVGFRDLLAHEAVDILQPQPQCCGGVTGWREALTLAEGAGLGVNCGGPSFLTCQLAAGTREPSLCEYLVPHMDTLALYFREKPGLQGHEFVLNPVAGNGLRLDEEFLRTHPAHAGWERST